MGTTVARIKKQRYLPLGRLVETLPPVCDGLIAYWPMDGGLMPGPTIQASLQNKSVDIAPYSTLTLPNTYPPTWDYAGRGLYFTGNTKCFAHTKVGYTPYFTSVDLITATIMVNPDAWANQAIVSLFSGYSNACRRTLFICMLSNGKVRARVGCWRKDPIEASPTGWTLYVDSTNTIPTGQFTQIRVTYNKSYLYLYFGNTLEGSAAALADYNDGGTMRKQTNLESWYTTNKSELVVLGSQQHYRYGSSATDATNDPDIGGTAAGWTENGEIDYSNFAGYLKDFFLSKGSFVLPDTTEVTFSDDGAECGSADSNLSAHLVNESTLALNCTMYNNYPSDITTSMALLPTEKYLGRSIVRCTYKPITANGVTCLASGAYGTGVYLDYRTYNANSTYWSSIFWRCSKPDAGIIATLSNIVGWSTQRDTQLRNDWRRCAIKWLDTVSRTDYKFFSIRSPSIRLNETLVVDWSAHQCVLSTMLSPYNAGSRTNGGRMLLPPRMFPGSAGSVYLEVQWDDNSPESWSSVFAKDWYTTYFTTDWLSIYRGSGWGTDYLNCTVWNLASNDQYSFSTISGMDARVGHWIALSVGWDISSRYIHFWAYDMTTGEELAASEVYRSALTQPFAAPGIFSVGSLSTANISNSRIRNLAFYSRRISITECRLNSKSKLHLTNTGDVHIADLLELPNSMGNATYVPLEETTKDRMGAAMASVETNACFHFGALWSGPSTTNLAGNDLIASWATDAFTGAAYQVDGPTDLTGACGRITAASGGTWAYFYKQRSSDQSIAVSASTYYTFSLLVKGDLAFNPNLLYVYEYTSGGAYIRETGVYTAANSVHVGGGWYWVWGVLQTSATTAFVKVWGYMYGVGTYWVSGLQVQLGAYPSPFTASTRGASSISLNRDLLPKLEQTAWTYWGWFNPMYLTVAGYYTILGKKATTNNRCSVMIDRYNNKLLVAWGNGTNYDTLNFNASAIFDSSYVNRWCFFALRRNGSELKAYFGSEVSPFETATSANATYLTAYYTTADWELGAEGGTNQFIGLLKNFGFTQAAMSDTAIADLFKTTLRETISRVQVREYDETVLSAD